MAGSAEGGAAALECWAEEVADARVTSREETLSIIEATILQFLQHVASGEDPTLHLVNQTWNLPTVTTLGIVNMSPLGGPIMYSEHPYS